MSQEKIYPKGVVCFDKHASAPDFVVGSLIITPRELIDWIKENESMLTEYNGKKQLKLQILKGSKGLYTTVDTYNSRATASQPKDDLPF